MALQDQWGRRERPFQRVAILGVALALVGLLVYRQIDRWRGDEVTVWLAASNLETGTRIAAEHLSPIQTRERAVPEGTILERRQIEGWELRRPKQQGTAFFTGDLVRPAPDPGPGLADLVPEGRVLMTFNLRGLPIEEFAQALRMGDHFDLFSFARTEGQPIGPILVARDLVFLGWIQERGPEGGGGGSDDSSGGLLGGLSELAAAAAPSGGRGGPSLTPFLLGVRPYDVSRMVWAQSTGAPISVVIHGRSEVRAGELLEVPLPASSQQIELITGARRRKMSPQRLQ